MRYKTITQLLASIALTIFIAFTITNNTSRPRTFERRNSIRNCTTDIALDLYGLGVRLGVYFQWVSGWVSNNFLVDSINGGLDANAIFLFALLIAIVNSTKSNAMTLMDGLIMIWLCVGTVWSVLSLWGYRTCIYRKKGLSGISKFGGFGTHLRLLLSGSVAIYGAWYWIFAIKGGTHGLQPFGDVDPSCGKSSVTVFGQDVTGISSNVALCLSIVAGVYAAVVILITPIAAYTRVCKMVIFWRTKQYGSSTRLRYATGASQRQLDIGSRILSSFNIFWIVFCVFAIEWTLNENYAVGVLGANPQSTKNILQPGQLLPLLIGSFSFIQTLFNVYELWRYPFSQDTAPSLGRAASNRQANTLINSKFNIFRLFSEGSTGGDPSSNRKTSSRDEDANQYLDLHLRLNPFQRTLITIFPHLSLFCFWPWNKDASHSILHEEHEGEDRMQLTDMDNGADSQTKRARFADQEHDAVGTINDNSRHQSPIRYDPHQVRETV